MTGEINRTESVCFYFFTVTALTIAGPPGPPGPPGPASNAASVSETLFAPQQDATNKRTITQESQIFPPFVRQLKTFATRDSMMQHTSRDAEGTLSYVTGTGSLYLKVAQGWKEIQVLSLFPGVNIKHQHQSNFRSFLFIIWNFSYSFKRCPAARQSDLPLQ